LIWLLNKNCLYKRDVIFIWKLKAGVGKQLGNKQVDSRSHSQGLKGWLWQEKATPGMWIEIARASLSLLAGQTHCLMIDGSSWRSGGLTYHFLTAGRPRLSVLYQGVSVPIWWLDWPSGPEQPMASSTAGS